MQRLFSTEFAIGESDHQIDEIRDDAQGDGNEHFHGESRGPKARE